MLINENRFRFNSNSVDSIPFRSIQLSSFKHLRSSFVSLFNYSNYFPSSRKKKWSIFYATSAFHSFIQDVRGRKKNVTSGWTSHLQRKWSTGNFHFELINQLRLDNPKLVDSLPVERHRPEVRVFPPGRRQVGGDEPNGRFTSASCHRKYSKDAIGLICIIEASLN